ncbi:MAG: PQQ-binding-like beta-propeller repeat protein, partial [Solirubrobacterales bacterium]|nr:PQQ-binding-like beta-propeller repeat protein [Solirubrobacterales bacterium]
PMTNAARRFTRADFGRFDLVLAMDAQNADDLIALAPDAAARARVRLLRSFTPRADGHGDLSVPDPYFGGDDGFVRAIDTSTGEELWQFQTGSRIATAPSHALSTGTSRKIGFSSCARCRL